MDYTSMLRVLIGDQASAFFTNDDLSVFLQLAGVSMTPLANFASSGQNDVAYGVVTELFFAAHLALNSAASKVATNLKEVRIGDFMDSSGRNQVTALRAAADAYLKVYYETPAWAIAETNESDLNALVTIRNFVLRTNP
jgi:hypothetical protein